MIRAMKLAFALSLLGAVASTFGLTGSVFAHDPVPVLHKTIKVGDGFQVPPETPHSARNGDKLTRLVVTYVVDKDKPLASPAPE